MSGCGQARWCARSCCMRQVFDMAGTRLQGGVQKSGGCYPLPLDDRA